MNPNIAEWVFRSVADWPNWSAFVSSRGDRLVTFRQFGELIDRIAACLTELGIRVNTRTAVMVPPGVEFAAVTMALFHVGAVPVLIDPGMGLRGLGRCLTLAAPEAFIGSRKAVLARRIFHWARHSIRQTVSIDALMGQAASMPALRANSAKPEAPAAILFTSGSTGPAKGVVYTHEMLCDQVKQLAQVFHFSPGEIDLCTFPLFALFAPALGMTSVIPEMEPTRPARADPRKLVDAVVTNRVTNIFGSPALLRVLGRFGATERITLPTVRRVISAGAPVSAAVMEAMTAMLTPGVEIFTPYGATEALPVSIIGSRELLLETRHRTEWGAGVCVGRPVAGVDVRIIPTHELALPSLPPPLAIGEIGEITVRGRVVSEIYWRNRDANDMHKIADGMTVWHRMGDLGYFDADGLLWFCGRKSQRVRTPSGTLHTTCCEEVFNGHPAVCRTALVGVKCGASCRPVLCVELDPAGRQRNRSNLRTELRRFAEHYAPARQIEHILFHPAFPVDVRHNAKINREKLARWAAWRVR